MPFTSSAEELPISIGSKFNIRYWASIGAIFVFVFLGLFPFIHLGIDITDVGYHLTNQDLANILGFKIINIVPFWWFSDLVGGWWLMLAENQSCLWARIGGAFAAALCSAIAAQVLFQIYKPSLLAIFFVVAVGLLRVAQIFNYLSVPHLLYLIFCLFFLKLNLEHTKFRYQFLSGIALSFLVFSRMPMILIVFPLLICLLICRKIEKEKWTAYFRAYTTMLSVTISCFLLFALCLYSESLLKNYISYQPPSKHHTIYSMLAIWFDLSVNIPLIVGLIIFTCFFVFFVKNQVLSNQVIKKKIVFLFLGFLAICLITLVGCWFSRDLIEIVKLMWPASSSLFLIMLALNVSYICLNRSKITYPEIVLFMLSISFPLLRSVGSASGFQAQGSILHFGLTGVWLSLIGSRFKCKIPLMCLNCLLLFIMCVQSVKALVAGYEHPIQKLTSNLNSSRLEGICTSSARAESFCSLIKEIRKHTKKGDPILAFPNIPMVYFASETVPLGDHAWLFLLDYEAFSKKLNSIAEMTPPILIVKSKADFENSDFGWPLSDPGSRHDRSAFIEEVRLKSEIFDEKIIKKWDMKLIWANDCFDILAAQ